MRDLALGLRLAVGGGRMSGAALLRLAMTAFGIALAVAVLLPAAAVHHLIGVQAEREAAITPVTEPRAGVAPLLAYSWHPAVGGDVVGVTAVAATGPNSPVPPGADRLPGPGELIVSPELAAKLASADGGALQARLPGHVVGRLSREGVSGAGDLTAYYGVPAGQSGPFVLDVRDGSAADRGTGGGDPAPPVVPRYDKVAATGRRGGSGSPWRPVRSRTSRPGWSAAQP